jgi:hypothetical protein
VLRRILRHKGKEAIEEWRQLHKEELRNLDSSANTFRVFTSRRIRWAGQVVRMEEIRSSSRNTSRKETALGT